MTVIQFCSNFTWIEKQNTQIKKFKFKAKYSNYNYIES